ncbi:MAG: sigma-54-dependent Fis family transcriptional regulator [Deltaproteobacteria bacterium]|nr:sigma-54-dependent Fis family transcriptional regulator [Deltaproteobacteria bacterium]
MQRILVCDDEELIRWSLKEHLGQEGYLVETAEDGGEALEAVERHPPDAMVIDLRMPNVDGLTALRRLREKDYEFPVIVITAHGAVDSAIEATQLGASAYLSKPFDLREVSLQLSKVLENSRLAQEVHHLRERQKPQYGRLVGQSKAMNRVFDTLTRLEGVDAPTVLISGESGTGKDLVAQAIHARGPRATKPYMEIDCASLPEQLIESELFGHEKGSFTDAHQTKPGLFEVARGGVIFLDEIGEMAPGTQAKLLRALENRKFKRVGGHVDLPLDAAVIAASNRDLKTEVEKGSFREDLFYRLNVIPIEIPSLRQRSGDIALLAEFLLDKLNREVGRSFEAISREALECMEHYNWPGNVRELRNVLERIVILNAGDTALTMDHLPNELRRGGGQHVVDGCPFKLPEEGVNLEKVEAGLIAQALERCENNQSKAARLLNISRYALRYRMEKYKL